MVQETLASSVRTFQVNLRTFRVQFSALMHLMLFSTYPKNVQAFSTTDFVTISREGNLWPRTLRTLRRK